MYRVKPAERMVKFGQQKAVPVDVNEATFRVPRVTEPTAAQAPTLTFQAFAEIWESQRGNQLTRPRDNRYRLERIRAFTPPGRAGANRR
jgi:hypothetical protein